MPGALLAKTQLTGGLGLWTLHDFRNGLKILPFHAREVLESCEANQPVV